MLKLPYDQLTDLADSQLCAEHKTLVVVAWHSGERLWTLRCGHDHYPDALVRIPSLTEDYRQGRLPEGPIADNIKRGSKKRAMSTNKQLQTQVLGDLPRADLATGEVLSPEMVHALTVYATKYGLDPYRGHVVLMYGKPYIGLDGYLFHATATGKPYKLNTRPLTKEELSTYQVQEGDHAWLCELVFPVDGSSFTGIGIVTQEEITAMSTKHPERLRSPVVAAHPWQLCQKRAEWQALRRGFPIGESEEIKEKEERHEPTDNLD